MTDKKQSSDFDYSEIIHTTSEHQKSLDDIQARVVTLETRVGTNESFGKTFAAAATDSVKLQTTVGTVLKGLLRNDTETKTAVGGVVKDIEGQSFKRFMKTSGAVIGAIVLALISGLAGYLIPR